MLSGRVATVLACLVLVVLSVGVVGQPLSCYAVKVVVYRDGSALVEEYVDVSGISASEVEIALLAEMDPSIPLVVLDEKDMPMPFKVVDGVVKVLVVNTSVIKLIYATQALTSKAGETWSVRISGPKEIMITLPSEATILYMSQIPELVDVSDEGLALFFNSSEPVDVQYMLEISVYVNVTEKKEPETSQTTGTQETQQGQQAQQPTQQPTQQPAQPPKTSPTPYVPPKREEGLNKYFILVVVAVIALLAVLLALKVSRGSSEVELRPEEENVIRLLRAHGGEAFQHVIAKEMGLPKTTMWRVVMRLRDKGVIEVEKRYGMNYLRLKKRMLF